jgi:hypothetical protein
MVDYNFSPKAPDARIVYRKLGNQNADLLAQMLQALITKDEVRPDLAELGQATGMTLKEVNTVLKRGQTDPNADHNADPGGSGGPTPPDGGGGGSTGGGAGNANAVLQEILGRVGPQVENAFRDNSFGPDTHINMGFKRRLEKTLADEGRYDPIGRVTKMYNFMDHWIADMKALGRDEFSGPASFMNAFEATLTQQLEETIR